MAEFWDVYSKSGKRKNRVIKRGDKMLNGEYHLVSEGWIRVDEDHYLIQKRSKNKKLFGDMWYCSVGGSVLAGEEPKEGLIREAREEIGIDISDARIRLKRIIVESFGIFYIYLIDKKIKLEDLVLQEDEVSEVKIVTLEEIFELIENGDMIKLDYYEKFFDSVKKIPISLDN
ncbi:NUDIX hydrolase [Peptoniphilus indolicus]|uniref:Nucleoside diphosphate hydrolase n=2 Tax=Peptoniphilus indolicus TaxID=33030 RepID=G4D3T7_9FIRM|nr:NUDIX domain-containing protein [Peptoniphilus indolicus]EGY79809.1 nucleoside diphosphate hydrolase [Peptoniphilus indolicus ATCC 29427]SUB75759.1 Isopentenyl-diphosphate Delta-isomerase [Peptoniphilus indolicus]